MKINNRYAFVALALILVGLLSFNAIYAEDLDNGLDVGSMVDSSSSGSAVSSSGATESAISDSSVDSSSSDSNTSDSSGTSSSSDSGANSGTAVSALSDSGANSGTADSTSSDSDLSNSSTSGSAQTDSQLSDRERSLNEFMGLVKNTSNPIVYLNEDIVTNQSITIKGKITIDGNNHTISAVNVSRIFYIQSTVTLRNIAFMGDLDQNMRAIQNAGTLTIENCQFSYFSYNVSGAAISSSGKLVVKNSEFVNDYSLKSGAAIYSTGDLTVSDTLFDNNYACSKGGAIYSSGKLTLKGCRINNNFAEGNGGAVYSLGNLSLAKCEFDSNYAMGYGGALYNVGNISVKESIFDDNYADGYGGAIYNSANLTISSCKFASNTCNASGGALYSKGARLTVKYSNFTGNSAAMKGGAVYSLADYTAISYSNFNLNSVRSYMKASNGGAVYIYHESKVSYSNFTSNSCKTILDDLSYNTTYQSMGGALCYYLGSHALTGCKFLNNSVDNDGGAVRVSRYVTNFSLSKCSFINNSAFYEDGGAVSSAGPKISISSSVFKQNFAYEDGGAIDIFSLGDYTVYALIKNCLFSSNTGFKAGGAMYLGANTTHSFIGSNFTSNKATVAGSIYLEALSANITRCIFKSNKAANVAKKTIYSKAGEVVTHSGGAVFIKKGSVVAIKGTLFSGNKADNGGAITNHGKLTADKSNFTSNKATYGGAIFGGGKSTAVKNSVLNKNSAGKTGGALYINEGTASLKASMIVKNSAKYYSGVYSTRSVSLNNNWWGNTLSNKNKSPKTLKFTNVKVSTWLILKLSSKASKLAKGKSTTLTVDLRYNNKNKVVSNSFNAPVTLSVTGGSLSSKKVYLKNGKATVTFKKTNKKNATVKATVLAKTASRTIKAK